MDSPIHPLPEQVVHRIAAGEVIDSLAAVVRELAENALDAGATRITVSLGLKQWQVRVVDNGVGMSPSDLAQAAQPHSTSKLTDDHDLWQIASLGFRGEALHSLAQLADLEICSRQAHTEDGWWLQYDHQGNPIQKELVAIAPGTIVTATNLFGTWLPRRQSLPTLNQQLRSIQTTIHNLALCHPHVTWQVEKDHAPWFSIWGNPSPQLILPQLIRDIHPTDLQETHLPISLPPPNPLTHQTLTLLLGLPDRCHRYRPDWVRVAINGRVVTMPDLEQTILQTLRRTLPRDRHPVCFLHLRVSPDQVDWNRHPAKAEIYLRHLASWQQQVSAVIDQALQLSGCSVSELGRSRHTTALLKTAEAHGAYQSSRSIAPVQENSSFPHQADLPGTDLRAVAQVHNMYILAEHPNGVWLVEQHIAHERVIYEQLCDRWQLVELEQPMLLNQLLPAQVEQLQRLGMAIEPFGDQLWAVRTIPERLVQRDDCTDAILELSLGGDLDTALVATACRTAIRNGTPLSLPDMQTLLNQWQRTRNPRTCPHGRPICLTLQESSLSRFFRRHWVIGKSHGI
jgi:DNA mismatch repair protein MutL